MGVFRGAWRRVRARAAFAILATVTLVQGPLTPAFAVSEQATVSSPSPTTSAFATDPEASLDVELVVATEEPVISPETSEVSVRVLVRNLTEEPLPAGRVTLALGERLTDPDVVALPSPSIDATALAELSVPATAAAATRSLDIAIPITDWPLTTTDAPGVFRLQGEFWPDADPALALDVPAAETTAPLVWRGVGAGATVPLAMIVPLVLPSDVLSMPSRTQLSEAVPRLEAALDAATAVGATLAIDPRIIAGIRAYGLNAPERAQEFLARLEASTLPSFLLQFADADPAAQSALGLEALLEPTSLSYVTRSGEFLSPEAEVSPEHDASETGDDAPRENELADPDSKTNTDTVDNKDVNGEETDSEETDSEETDASATAPTLEELLAWPQGLPWGWPAEGNANSATLALLQGVGLTTTVLDSDNVSGAGGPRATLDSGEAIVTDHDLGAALRLAMKGEDPAELARGRSVFMARLAAAAGSDAPGLILGIDRNTLAEGAEPWDLLTELTSAGWITPTPVMELPTGSATLTEAEGGTAKRLEHLEEALQREPEVLAIRSLLTEPEYLDGYQRARLLNLFATRFADQSTAFSAAVTTYAERDAELSRGVRAIDTQHTQLVGASTRVPVQIQNALPFSVHVTTEVVPTSAVLSVSETHYPDLTIGARSNETLLVPVKSRVSSGESHLHVTISDVEEEFVAYSGDIEVSVSTHIEVIALSVLGAAGVLLFGLGIYRSVRRSADTRPRGIARS